MTKTLVALAALVTRVYQPLTGLTNARVDLMTSFVSFDRVFEVLDAPVFATTGVTVVGDATGGTLTRTDGGSWITNCRLAAPDDHKLWRKLASTDTSQPWALALATNAKLVMAIAFSVRLLEHKCRMPGCCHKSGGQSSGKYNKSAAGGR